MLHQHKRDNKKTKAKILTQQKNKTKQNKTNTKFLHKYLSTVSNVQQYFDKKSRILNDDNNYDSISTKQFWILDNRFVFCINKQINNSQLTQSNSKQCCIHHIYIYTYIYIYIYNYIGNSFKIALTILFLMPSNQVSICRSLSLFYLFCF